MSQEVLLSVKDLRTEFFSSKTSSVTAIKDVSFDMYRGEVLGLVGESGSGKSTLAKSILGMTEYQGEIVHPSRRPQMVFQDPYSSLNPAFSIRRIVEEPLRIYGKPATPRSATSAAAR